MKKKKRMVICILNTVILEWGRLKMREFKDEEASFELDDDLRRVIVDPHREPESANEKRKLKDMRCACPSLYRPEVGDGCRTRGIAITSCTTVGGSRSACEASPLTSRRLPKRASVPTGLRRCTESGSLSDGPDKTFARRERTLGASTQCLQRHIF
jgi:hypothetical protein